MTVEALRSIWPWVAGAVGLCLGSFYNVCIHRYLSGQSIIFPASHCPACQRKLRVWELIPVVSFLLLRGRCATCGARIRWRYPVVELLSGLWAWLLAVQYGLSWAWLLYMIMGGIFLVASFIDLELYILPDFLTLPAIPLALAGSVFVLHKPWGDVVLGSVLGGGLFYLLHVGYRWLRKHDGLGLGDVKLMFAIGGLVGWQLLPLTILTGSVAALLGALPWLRQGERGSYGRVAIPFGPFLSLGCMVVILYGGQIMAWYLRASGLTPG